MQGIARKHTAELESACASTAQVKDCEARFAHRLATLGQGLEDRISDAAAMLSKTALQQGQGKFEALRDRMLSSLGGLQDQVCATSRRCVSLHRHVKARQV